LIQTSPRWAIECSSQLIYQQWGDAHFVFHPASGQTHYLNQSCVDVLELLAEKPLSNKALYQQLLERYSIDEDAELREAIARVMPLLEQLGVVASKP
jgi:PqqD family protein of HPr-rel-A system